MEILTCLASVLYWDTKSEGISGNCSIIAYNSLRGPAQAAWSSMLEEDCDNVNLVTDWVNAAMSTDGSLIAATSIVFEDTLSTVLVASYNGQTGDENWRRRWRAPDAASSQFWANRGIAVSADGRWVATAVGAWNAPVPLLVLDAITGEPRSAAPMPTCDVVAEPQISADGGLVLVKDADGSASLFHWDSKTSAYLPLGLLKPPNPGSWSVVATTFGSAPTPLGAKPTVGIAWVSNSLLYAQFAMFEVVGEGASLLSSWMSTGSSKYAVSDAAVSCGGHLCAGGFDVGDDTSVPSVIVLSATAGCTGPVFQFSTGGSVKSVQLAPGPDAATTYLAASGCSTQSVCTGPGGNAFMWKLTA
jgi:hypothetical protein